MVDVEMFVPSTPFISNFYMIAVTDGFISWERFDHKEALKHFRQAKLLKTDRQQKYFEDLITERNRIAAQFSSQYPNLKGNVPTTYLIADVFQNARRREL
jgi:hypothetical protein